MAIGERAGLARLVEDANAAAFDDALWPLWLERLVGTFDGVGGTFFAFDPGDRTQDRIVPLWDASGDMIAEYAAVWAPHDPQKAFADRARATTIYTDLDHLDRRDPTVDAFMTWGEKAAGFGHHLGAVTLSSAGGGTGRVGFCVHRRVGEGVVPPRHRAMLSAALPAIANAFALGLTHGAKLQQAFWDGLTAGGDGEAAFLLDGHGRMIRATAAALAIVAAGDGLDLTHGRLGAAQPGDDAHLQAVIARGVARYDTAAGAASIGRRSGLPRYVVVVHPLPRAQRLLAPVEAAALVAIVDPAIHASGAPALLRDAFGLTLREADLASTLQAGHSIESAASELSMALPTARQHLRRLFAKTGTSRQSELLRLLDRIV